MKCAPKLPKQNQLAGSDGSSGKSTFTDCASFEFSARVLDTNPGPVVNNTAFFALENGMRLGNASAAHEGSRCARTQFSIIA